MSLQTESMPRKWGLDTPLFQRLVVNWEIIFYVAIFGLAIATRFFELGARAMSHDESLHTLYSWNLYTGRGYQHDPLMHGPFLFHITALMYFLFGDNDFTARISVALFGVVLVVLPYWFRPWLGKWGALLTSFLLLISPGVLFYSRYIRNEAYVMVFTVVMVMAFFQYMRTRATRWLYIGALGVVLMMTAKEVAYIHGFIGLTFILLAWMWESMAARRGRRLAAGLATVVLALGVVIAGLSTFTEFFTGAAPGETLASEIAGILIKVFGLLLGVFIVWLGTNRISHPVRNSLEVVREQWVDLVKAVTLSVIIFIVLHTTFFSNIEGILSGTYGAIEYWLRQQEVQRGSQPWYYYLMLVPLYEFLPVLLGGIGGVVYVLRGFLLRKPFPAFGDDDVEPFTPGRKGEEAEQNRTLWPSDGGLFAAFLLYWVLLSFAIYSWAGEKMPWLSVHMTLPLIFLTGHVFQAVITGFEWNEARRKGALWVGGMLLLMIPAVMALFTTRPFQSQSLQSITETTQFITAAVILVGLAGGVWFFGRRMGGFKLLRVAFLTGTLVLSLLTIRFAWLLTYVNYDYVNEFMVYAHGSPDIKLALNQIEEISRRTAGDKQIKVAYDNLTTWPMEWYLREYPNRAFYGENPNRDALDAPIVLVGAGNESKVTPYLGEDYTRFGYRLVWWPVEDYKNVSFQRLWQTYVVGPPTLTDGDISQAQAMRRQAVRDNWRKLAKILFFREYEDYTLNEWPFVSRFSLYVHNDALQNLWEYQSGPVQVLTQGGAAVENPYEGKYTELTALRAFGSNGTGEGQFMLPREVAVSPDGEQVYVADSGNHRIQVFDTDGQFLFEWGEPTPQLGPGETAGPGQFSEPWGLAVGPEGNVYVSDTWNHRLQAFTAEGEFLWEAGSFVNAQADFNLQQGDFWGPRGVAVDSAGNVYVADTGNKRIQKFSPDGEFLEAWGGGGVIEGAFEEPVGIAIDSDDNIYVADTWNRRIQKFDANLQFVTAWEVVGGWEGESVVNKPYIAIDEQDRVFITDPENYRVVAYDSTGEVLLTFGQYGQDLGAFGLPVGIAADGLGHLFVVDSDNHRVLKFALPDFAP